ncbi:MAG: glycosyltransferase family 39 protein [Candidatus Omnitrophica bacterium]|nr:glycosyltransferase family 39 protein [Candidatus Omnitrophota bacterium]
MKKIPVNLLAFFLLVIFAFLAFTSIWPDRKSPTCDELAHHIPTGYILLTKHDYKMDTSHPPLSRYIVALPLKIVMHLNVPNDSQEWRRADRSEFGKDFFYKYNNQPQKIIFYSRLAIILVGLFCGWILFYWTKRAYSPEIALFALFFYSFCPNILAHTALATTDMVATCFILLSVASFWFYLRNNSLRNIIIAGISLGLAQLSKYTSVLLYLIFLLVFSLGFLELDKNRRKFIFCQILAIFAISIIVLWAGYGFDFEPVLKNAMRQGEKLAIAHDIVFKLFPSASLGLIQKLDSFLLNVPIPLGAHILGILGILRHGYEGHGTFFLGKWSVQGHPLYFLVAFLIKTQIPVIIFLLVGLGVCFKERIKLVEKLMVSVILVFFVTASMNKLQLGLRYILPIYPFCFILAARSVILFKKKAFQEFLFILMFWYVLINLFTWPNYLSYFNEFVGGPRNGYKYLRDSNIDWGQDLPGLKKYMKDNLISDITFYYFGTAEPSSYGINFKNFDSDEFVSPRDKIYAISVHRLDTVAWTKRFEPTARIGYSIFIYDFRVKVSEE